MHAATAPLLLSYYPTTFIERGAAVPFTTPLLAGARARPAERGGTELIVANPAGGRGVYILPWGGVQQLCRPTVHDNRLNQIVAGLAGIGPGGIRSAARQVAAEGLAGRAALQAAGRATAAEAEERLVTNYLLLRALIGQADPAGASELGTNAAAVKERAQRAVARIAPRLGQTPQSIARVLEEVAAIGHAVGLPGQAPPPRLMRMLAALRDLREQTALWSREAGDDSGTQAAMIGAVVGLTIQCAEKTIAEAQALCRDVPGLIQRWNTAMAETAAILVRPDWLLDGWEQIWLLWRTAESQAARRAAIAEMALLIPMLPRELADWVGAPIAIEELGKLRKSVQRNEDWRTGHLFDLIARNEMLRALAA